MLEQRIENLENQVVKLTDAAERLIDVLSGKNPPLEVAELKAVKKTSTQKTKRASSEGESSNNKKTAKTPSIEEVRESLTKLATTKGKKVAQSLMADFGATKMSEVDVADYPHVISASNALLDNEEAA